MNDFLAALLCYGQLNAMLLCRSLFRTDAERVKVRSHQTRMTRINRAIHAKLDAWTFWVYSLHSRVKFTTQQTRIRVMGGASCRQLQSRCKMYSCFCKSTKMYIQLRLPTYNHNYFVLHCCFGFSASARNDVTARASSWLVNSRESRQKIAQFAPFAPPHSRE